MTFSLIALHTDPTGCGNWELTRVFGTDAEAADYIRLMGNVAWELSPYQHTAKTRLGKRHLKVYANAPVARQSSIAEIACSALLRASEKGEGITRSESIAFYLDAEMFGYNLHGEQG